MLDKATFAGIMRISFDDVNVDDSQFVAAMENEENEDMTDAEAFAQLDDDDMEDLVVEVEVPESFTMNLHISQIIGYKAEPDTIDWGKTEEELEAMSDEEWEQFMKENCPADYFDFFHTFPVESDVVFEDRIHEVIVIVWCGDSDSCSLYGVISQILCTVFKIDYK